jgi:hypothetical protein
MVLDIGWAETTVTSVYEYREVGCNRSIRASKQFGEAMFKMLAQLIDPTAFEGDHRAGINREERDILSFEECEEVIARMAWCLPAKKAEPKTTVHELAHATEKDESRSCTSPMNLKFEDDLVAMVSIPLASTTPPGTIQLPFSKLAEPCETTFFAAGKMVHDLDDEELPLHILLYRGLRQLPVDVRSLCMSRIIFVGGGSKIKGLKERILDEVSLLIEKRGWENVQGRAVQQFHDNPKLQHSRNRQSSTGPTEALQVIDGSSKSKKITALLDQESDPVEEGLKREASKRTRAVEKGYLRAVESLGAWSGGSLISQLKIPAVSIIDREQWLLHGVSGASRGIGSNMATQRQNIGPSAFKSGAADRSSWTLGLWG